MRKDVAFETEDGVTLQGWLYLPDRTTGRVPAVVMPHGFSSSTSRRSNTRSDTR